MATKKSTKTTKSSKTAKSTKTEFWSIYGARESKSGERANISLVTGSDEARKWITVSLKKKGGKVKVKMTDETVILTIPRLDIEEEDEEEDEDDEDDDEDWADPPF